MAQSLPYAQLLSLFWTPLVAVTTSWEGYANGQIAVSVHGASIVPDRPRVIVQLYKTNLTHALVQASGSFAINVLNANQLEVAHVLGFVSGRTSDKLANVPYRLSGLGNPVLNEGLGWLDCRVINRMDGGDMTCFLADVIDGEARVDLGPLWWREMRQRMPQSWQQEWDSKLAREIEISRSTMDLPAASAG